MEAKALLIPLAAFALSATGVSAFNSEVLEKAGLNEDQISAFEEAHELRKEGNKDAARTVLENAGIDLHTMEALREAMHEHKQAMHSAIDEAVDDNNYEAFKEAIAGSPLADIITTQADFELFSEAHKLHEEGKHQEAKEIMEELGMHPGVMHKRHHEIDGHMMGRFHGFMEREEEKE